MARDRITTRIEGREDIFRDLDNLQEQLPHMVSESFKAQQTVIKDAIQRNWVGMAGGKSGDFIYDSVGFSTHYGANGMDVVGTAGVYKIDSVAVSNGRGPKDLSASQVAYWVEFGTSRRRDKTRKVKGAEYDPSDLISISPKPFIGNAFYNTLNEQEAAFAEEWSVQLSKVTR